MQNPIWTAGVKGSGGGGGGGSPIPAMDALYTIGRPGNFFYTDILNSYQESTPITPISPGFLCGLQEGQRTLDPTYKFDITQVTGGLKPIVVTLPSEKLALNFAGSGDKLTAIGQILTGPGAHAWGWGGYFKSFTKNCAPMQLIRSGGQSQAFSQAGNIINIDNGALSSGVITTETYHTIIVISDGANSELYLDGVLVDTGNLSSGANWSQYIIGGIGNNTFNNRDWDTYAHFVIEGDIAALDEVSTVNNFLEIGKV